MERGAKAPRFFWVPPDTMMNPNKLRIGNWRKASSANGLMWWRIVYIPFFTRWVKSKPGLISNIRYHTAYSARIYRRFELWIEMAGARTADSAFFMSGKDCSELAPTSLGRSTAQSRRSDRWSGPGPTRWYLSLSQAVVTTMADGSDCPAPRHADKTLTSAATPGRSVKMSYVHSDLPRLNHSDHSPIKSDYMPKYPLIPKKLRNSDRRRI